MTTLIRHTPKPAPSRLRRSLLLKTISALRRVATTIREWLAARGRAAADRYAFANMSERELLDIGVVRASVDAVADGTWRRDYWH